MSLHTIITGRVTDVNSAPISGVSIQLIQRTFQVFPPKFRQSVVEQTTSTADGTFSIALERADSQNDSTILKASKPGFATLNYFLWELDVPSTVDAPDKSVITRNIGLPEAALITGTVTTTDGAPLADALIVAVPYEAVAEGTIGDSSASTSTAQGRFEIKTLPPGPVQITVSLGERDLLVTTATAPAKDLRFVVSTQNGKVRGKVVNVKTNSSVAGASVTLYRKIGNGVYMYPRKGGARVITDANGVFEYENLPAGRFVFLPAADGLFPLQNLLSEPGIAYSAGGTSSGIVVKMAPGLEITGHVYEMGTSTPISGVTVKWSAPEMPVRSEDAVTNADGEYRITGIPSYTRQVSIVATADGYSMIIEPSPEERHIVPGFVIGHGMIIDFPPGADSQQVDIQMHKKRTISGQVVDVEGNPLAGVQVSTKGDDFGKGLPDPVMTGPDGRFTVSGDPGRAVFVFAYKPGWPMTSALVPADSNTSSSTIITMAPGGSISGMVIAPDGQPVGNAHIQVGRAESPAQTGMANNLPSSQSNADGTFQIKDLPAGKISLYAKKGDFAPTRFIHIDLAPGEARNNVTLQLGKGYTISGRVTDAEGNPVADARISADSADFGHPIFVNTQTGIDGRYKLTGVEDRTITISVWDTKTGKHEERENVDPKDGRPVDFVLQ